MPRISQIIATLEAEKVELEQRLKWVETQLETFRDHAAHRAEQAANKPPEVAEIEEVVEISNGAASPTKRGKRLEKSSRARQRRAAVKPYKRDLPADIEAFLAKHPQSTTGDVARGVDANRSTVASRLTQMTKLGQLVKSDDGYSLAPEPAAARK